MTAPRPAATALSATIEPAVDAVRPLDRALGLTGLLVMLRFDAERFGAAEYDEVDARRPAAVARRRWPGTRSASAWSWSSCMIHPDPQTDLHLRLGDRLEALVLGLAYGGVGHRPGAWPSRGCATADLRFPAVRLVPGRADQRGRRPRSSTRRRSAASSSASCSDRVDAEPRDRLPGPPLRPRDAARGAGRDRVHARPVARRSASSAAGVTVARAASAPRSSATRSPASRSSSRPATPVSPRRAAARTRRSSAAAGRRRAGASSARVESGVARGR